MPAAGWVRCCASLGVAGLVTVAAACSGASPPPARVTIVANLQAAPAQSTGEPRLYIDTRQQADTPSATPTATATPTPVPPLTPTMPPALDPAVVRNTPTLAPPRTSTASPTPATPSPSATAPPATPAAAHAPGAVYAVGDSVMLGAAAQLHAAGVVVDAAVDRGWDAGVAVVQAWAAQGIHPPVLLVGLGNNSAVSASDVDALMAAAGSAQVYFLEVYEPSLAAHMQAVNAVLAAAPARYPNAHILDWPSVAPQAVCSSDHIHISCGGAGIYAQFVLGAIG